MGNKEKIEINIFIIDNNTPTHNYRKTLFNSPTPMNENSTIFKGWILLIPMSFLENGQISRGDLIME